MPDFSLRSALAKNRNDSAMGYQHHRNNPTSTYKSRWCRSDGTSGMPAKRRDFTRSSCTQAVSGVQSVDGSWRALPFADSAFCRLAEACRHPIDSHRFLGFLRVCKHNHSPLLLDMRRVCKHDGPLLVEVMHKVHACTLRVSPPP